MEDFSTARLTEIAERKLHLLTQLRELSLDQHGFADAHRIDELLSLLSRKSDVIDRLKAIQDELKPFQLQDPDQRQWPSEAERVRCRELFEKSEKMLAELLVIDNRTLGEMTQQREVIGQQLSQFTSAEAIFEAYGGTNEYGEELSASSLLLEG